MKQTWNKRHEPISERLRDDHELRLVSVNNIGIYNPRTQQSGIISNVFIIEPDIQEVEDEFFHADEDRWVEYITDTGPEENYSVDLDDEGWLWLDELKGESQ